jgi:hypothetical protein
MNSCDVAAAGVSARLAVDSECIVLVCGDWRWRRGGVRDFRGHPLGTSVACPLSPSVPNGRVQGKREI